MVFGCYAALVLTEGSSERGTEVAQRAYVGDKAEPGK